MLQNRLVGRLVDVSTAASIKQGARADMGRCVIHVFRVNSSVFHKPKSVVP